MAENAVSENYAAMVGRRRRQVQDASSARPFDVMLDTVAPKRRQHRKTVRDFEELIVLSAAQKTYPRPPLAERGEEHDDPHEASGFEGLDSPQLIIDELKAASPDVHDLLVERRDKKVSD